MLVKSRCEKTVVWRVNEQYISEIKKQLLVWHLSNKLAHMIFVEQSLTIDCTRKTHPKKRK
jgi:hypothetical protein